MPKALRNVQLKSLPFKSLLIWFTKDTEEAATLKYKDPVSKAKKELDILGARNLSIKGRTTIIKSLIVS